MIEATDWKVRIDRPIGYKRLDFYLYRHVGSDTIVMQADGSGIHKSDGYRMVPTFSLSGYDGRQLMLTLVEALSEAGVRSPNDHSIRGQLEAQTAHLNDLRMLLKLNKPSGDKVK